MAWQGMARHGLEILKKEDLHNRAFFVPKIRFREETIMKKTNDLPRDWKQRPTLSVQLTAGVFGCTAAHIFNQISRNEIPAIKLGRRIIIPTWWVRQKLEEPNR